MGKVLSCVFLPGNDRQGGSLMVFFKNDCSAW